MHKTIERLLDVSGQYDRVMVCDEPLLRGVLECSDARVDAILPASRANLALLLDKPRFPRAAKAAGLPVARSYVGSSPDEVRRAVAGIGGPVMVKRRVGHAGRGVKPAKSVAGALKAADELGYPVLVEERLSGDLALMPCLFDRGRPSARLPAERRSTYSAPRGPSSVVEPWPVDEALREVADTAGAAFGIDGYASFDLFRDPSSGRLWVIELNPRAAPAHALGARFGVDMAALLRLVHEAAAPHEPQLAQGRGRVPLFPQELQRLRRKKGKAAGTWAWATTRGALREVPWRDPGLMRYYIRMR